MFKTKKTSAFAKNYHRTSNLGDEGHFCNQIFLKCWSLTKQGTQWTQDKGWRLSPKYFGSGACAPDDFEKEPKPNSFAFKSGSIEVLQYKRVGGGVVSQISGDQMSANKARRAPLNVLFFNTALHSRWGTVIKLGEERQDEMWRACPAFSFYCLDAWYGVIWNNLRGYNVLESSN